MNEQTISQLNENTQALIDFVISIDNEKALITPPSGKWSIIQICDHLMSVDFGIFSLMSLEGAQADQDRESKKAVINEVGINRDKKYTSPPPLEPKGKTDTLEKFKTKFPSLRSKMCAAIADKDISRVCDKFSHFVLGEFTFEEWIYFSIQHTNRHKLQMEEVLSELSHQG